MAEKEIKYKHLFAWDKSMGSYAYWIAMNQERAEKENAPLDAVYRSQQGWVTMRDIGDDAARRTQIIHDHYFPDPS
jgi:hypothetical protein